MVLDGRHLLNVKVNYFQNACWLRSFDWNENFIEAILAGRTQTMMARSVTQVDAERHSEFAVSPQFSVSTCAVHTWVTTLWFKLIATVSDDMQQGICPEQLLPDSSISWNDSNQAFYEDTQVMLSRFRSRQHMQACCANKMGYDRLLSTVSAQKGARDSLLPFIRNA